MQKWREEILSVPALKPLLTEVRVSATLTLGGATKLGLKDTVLYVGPCQIDGELLAKLKSGETVDLHMPPTSFDDVLQLLQKGLSATAGADSQVLRLGQVRERERADVPACPNAVFVCMHMFLLTRDTRLRLAERCSLSHRPVSSATGGNRVAEVA